MLTNKKKQPTKKIIKYGLPKKRKIILSFQLKTSFDFHILMFIHLCKKKNLNLVQEN